MATFYVGQRVRIKWSYNWPELAGTEATIAASVNEIAKETVGHMEWHIAPDAWGGILAPRPSPFGATGFGASSDQLEPIQYDGNKVIEWSECLWQPEHIRTAT